MNDLHPLAHRKVLLVSRHQKESAIAPPLQTALGIELLVTHTVDTDAFGTFSGERERPDSQLNTARRKARAALDQHPEADLVLASEGAFYPHPDSPFITVNSELLLLTNRSGELEVTGYCHQLVHAPLDRRINETDNLAEAATALGFPENGLILVSKDEAGIPTVIRKDLTDWESLETAYRELIPHSGRQGLRLQVDLRAHRYPRRMQHIARATDDLVKNLLSRCPRCRTPGFSITDYKRGLPCDWCGRPTRSIQATVSTCRCCSYSSENWFPDGRLTEEPGRCDYCNP